MIRQIFSFGRHSVPCYNLNYKLGFGGKHMARDMTKGNITGHLIAYAVPLVFGNLFQQLYHTVDSVVVGQFYGKEALAAVGAAGPIMNILTFLIVGLSLGASILMASYFGAKDYQNLKDEFATSVLSGLLFDHRALRNLTGRKPPVLSA